MAVKWGILSTARINLRFIAGARKVDGVQIAAVASRSAEAAHRYAGEHQIERAYGSYEDLLADPDLDAIYVSLPNALHLTWARRALQAGKHVLCEKPLGRRGAEVQEAFELAEREKRLLMEAFMYRHHPQTQTAKRMVDDGAIGRLRLVKGAFGFLAADAGNIRLRAALEGGALMDVGCYCVNAARLLAGEPERVAAEQVRGGDGVDVVFAGTLRCPGDVLAQFDSGLAVYPRDLLEVVGDRGVLAVDDPWHCRDPGITLVRDGRTERIGIAPADPYTLEAANFSAAIRDETAPLLGREDAVGQACVIEALYEAADRGRVVEVELPKPPVDLEQAQES